MKKDLLNYPIYKGFSLEKSEINFQIGQNERYLRIYSSNETVNQSSSIKQGTIYFVLKGINKDQYEIIDKLSFTVVDPDY